MNRSLGRLPEIGELLTFVTAADERSIRRTASRLHMSPAGIGKRLDNLESILQQRLLVRGPRGLQMTPEGRDFYQRAARLLDDAEALLGREAVGPTATLRGIRRLLGRPSPRSTEAVLLDTELLLAEVLEMLARRIELSGQEVVLARITDLTRERVLERRLATRIRRQARVSTLGRLVLAREPVHVVLEAALVAAREELTLETADVVSPADDGRLRALTAVGREAGRLTAAAERHRRTWNKGDVVARFEGDIREPARKSARRSFVVCAPLPGSTCPRRALVGIGGRTAELDEDDRAFLSSITAVTAAALAAGDELEAA